MADTIQASDGGMATADRVGEMVVARAITTREGQRLGDCQDTLIAHTLRAEGHVADTITANWHRSNGAKAGNNAGVLNPIINHLGVRRLTPRECERLQGFPDDWTRYAADGQELSNSARYRMLGNAVCVNVAEWIGRRIVEAIG